MMSRESQAIHRMPRTSPVWQVVEYLHLNKGEVLTRKDVATKFEIESSTIDDVLKPAVDAGLLKRLRDSENGLIWRRPQRLRTPSPFPQPFTGSLTAAVRSARAERRATLRIDFAAIRIEHGVPLVERLKRSSQWKALFDAMGPGDSFQVPTPAYDALAHARQAYRKLVPAAEFVIRKLDGQQTRIWRTA